MTIDNKFDCSEDELNIARHIYTRQIETENGKISDDSKYSLMVRFSHVPNVREDVKRVASKLYDWAQRLDTDSQVFLAGLNYESIKHYN